MLIYCISLEKDTMRRENLKNFFPKNYCNMKIINAINGKKITAEEFFLYSNQFYKTHKKIIAPSEVGCTLSHIKAYKDFLETNEEYCLVIEDDIIGNDDDISEIENIILSDRPEGIVLFGGQEGVPKDYWKYVLAKKTKNLYLISNFSKKFLFGAYCYVINRSVAEELVEMHNRNFNFTDNWGDLIKLNNMYFFNLIKHPQDFIDSNINSERNLVYSTQHMFNKKNILKWFLFKFLNRAYNELYRFFLIFKGYRNVRK
ncbi:glycosyltransferase family 25 protein [Acinetobacter sp. YH12039]|uniref:glycosyltransferase family 25 protein n=1 Tax=Acinetobacter sp. YH12039 TaxID=2601047 RepID=UPI0015D1A2BF|nr:glycosyltransferase family 25 protein [Acinetobacter sp. YH12039]